MMQYNIETINAYIDEYGGYGFDFSKTGNSKQYIIVAVLIKQSDISNVAEALKVISKKNFGGGEIKSNNVKGDNKRRTRILKELLELPFQYVAFIVDKESLFSDSGLTKSKRTFIKFLNEHFYDHLSVVYPKLNVVADEVGQNDFVTEFMAYVKKHQKSPSLFDEHSFRMVNSKEEQCVQIADFIAGTLSYVYEDDRKSKVPSEFDYLKLLDSKNARTIFFPKSYDESLFQHKEESDSYNKTIAETSYRQAIAFLQKYGKDADEERRMQVLTLDYLLFRFKYNALRRYISTEELRGMLRRSNYPIGEQSFRNKVIGKLRDSGVILSSSSLGYTLPKSKKEIMDYFKHVNSVVLPMMQRLKTCEEILKMTDDGLELIENDNFRGLKILLDAYRNSVHNE